MSAAPTPTGAQAIAYVRAHFARPAWGQPVTVCGVLPCPHAPEARDVLFVTPIDPKPSRMTVWFEPTGADSFALYGEW